MEALIEKVKTFRLATLATTVQIERFNRAWHGKKWYEF